MVTAVYLSDYFLKVVVGKPGSKKIEIHQAFQEEIPSGFIVNGNILSEEAVADLLMKVWKAHGLSAKRVRVVINAMPITLRKMALPAMRKKELLQTLQRELSGQEQEDLIAYRKLSRGRKRLQVYAAAVPRAYLEKYQRVFQKAGIRPAQFLPSRICLEKGLSHVDVLRRGTSIVQVLDGVQLTSVLWEGKEAVYAAGTNIFAEYGSFQFGLEVARSVSKLMQFYLTQENSHGIEKVYLSGISEKDFLICEEAILQMVPNVSAFRLEQDASVQVRHGKALAFGTYLNLAGALFNRRNEMNLLMPKKKKAKKKQTEFWKYARMPLMLTVGCTAITAAFLVSNQMKQDMLDDVKRYLNDTNNVAKCQELDELELENGLLAHQTMAVQYINQALSSYPEMNSSVIKGIETCAGDKVAVQVSSYLARDGLLTLEAAAEEADLSSQFVGDLQDLGLFQKIDYTGYVYSQADERYHISLLCYLKSDAGKEEVEGR